MGGALTVVEGECAAGAGIGFLLWERAVESEENNCKGVHSLMPNLGHVVDSGGLVHIHPGFHQRYERASGTRGLDWDGMNLVEIEEHQAGDLVFAQVHYLYILLEATSAYVIIPIAKVP